MTERALPEVGELRFLTLEVDGGVVIAGAENVGEALAVPARIGGKPVLAIGVSAFQGNARLERVALPEGLRRVERCAFQGCARLTEVALPGAMECIGESAFQGCSALRTIDLPEGLEEISARAFYGCSALERVVIPEGVLRIGERAFAGCKALASAVLAEGLRSIGHRAFFDCPALKGLSIPASVTQLTASALPRGDMAEGQYYLAPQAMLVRAEVKRHYALPRGTRLLAGEALARNDALLTVDFGDALEAVGPYALAECVCLKSAALPPSVREVGRGAFSGCERMTEAALSPAMKAIPGEAFLRCLSLERVELFEGLEAVGERAFEDCRALKSLALPEGVKSVGERAFYRCVSLERLELPESLAELGAGALSGCAGLRVLVLRGDCDADMLQVLEDARQAAILAPKLPPEAFPGHWRKRVCLGYALSHREGVPYLPEAEDACVEWMRIHGDAFIPEALRDKTLMHLLAEEGCLSLQGAQTLLERADGPDRDEYYLTLLEYRNRRFGGEESRALSLW